MSTLAQFRSSVAGEVGLNNTTSGDQTQIDAWVNQGVTDVLLRTSCQVRCADLTLTVGTAKYTLPTQVLRIISVEQISSNAISYMLEETSLDNILAMRRASVAYVSPAQYYSLSGADFFMIYPTPAAADTVSIYYVPRPVVLSASSDTPTEVPSEFHPLVEYFAFYRAATYTDDASSQQGQMYMQRYEMLLRQMKRDIGLKGNHRLPLADQRRSRNLVPFHDRSQYPGGSY